MSTTYGGQPASVVAPGSVAIASSTNANPIVVTTSANHGLLSGDTITISGHQANTAANGTGLVVTVLSNTSFSIPVAGVAVGGATGTVQLTSRGAAGILYTDGDPFTAAGDNLAIQPLYDRTAALAKSLGFTKTGGRLLMTNPNGTQAADFNGAFAASTWQSFAALAAFSQSGTNTGGLTAVSLGPAAAFAVYGVGGFAAQDLIEVTFEGSVLLSTSTAPTGVAQNYFGLYYQFAAPGAAAPTSLATMTLAPESTRVVAQVEGIKHAYVALRSTLFLPQAASGANSVLYVAPAVMPANADAAGFLALQSGCHFDFKSNRLTGWPQ